MNSRTLPVVLILLGTAFWMGSVAWNSAVGAGNVWTDEQAAEYASAAKNLHDLVNAPAHQHDSDSEHKPPQGDAAEAEVRFREIESARDRAIATKTTGSLTLQVLSGLCSLAGIVIYVIQRSNHHS